MAAKSERQILMGLAHRAANALGLDDEARKAKQMLVTGCESCSEMSPTRLRVLLWSYRLAGVSIGVPSPPVVSAPDRPTGAQITQIERLCAEKGLFGLDDPRLAKFVGRTAKVDAVEFLTHRQASNVITGLSRWDRSNPQS